MPLLPLLPLLPGTRVLSASPFSNMGRLEHQLTARRIVEVLLPASRPTAIDTHSHCADSGMS
jgi:hypothetical protein